MPRRHKTFEEHSGKSWEGYRHNQELQAKAHGETANDFARLLGKDLVDGNLPDGYLCDWSDLFGSSRR